jgi:hypothetical protein
MGKRNACQILVSKPQDFIKMDIRKNRVWTESNASGQVSMTEFSELGDEPYGFIKTRNFFTS